jgi:hypothetical protein
MNIQRTALFVTCFIASFNAFAYQQVPGSGSMHVTELLPRNYGETLNNGIANQGFYFVTDTQASNLSCGNGAYAYGIPLLDPQNANANNPAYRDYVNAVMLAYMLAKPIVVYVDGCINGSIPRVVGIDVWN